MADFKNTASGRAFLAGDSHPAFFQKTLSSVQGLSGLRARNLAPVARAMKPVAQEKKMLKRIAVFVYGVASYAAFFATFLYAIGFIGNLVVPKSIDSPAKGSLLSALGIDVLLLAIFAVQHSVMARPWFKRAWTRVVPVPAERSTYVLLSSVALIALFAFWQPLGGTVWNIENPSGRLVMHSIMGLGFGLVLVASFLINHFDLFGLRQVSLYLIGKPYTHLGFRTPLFYKYVRHPLYIGWLLSFWFTPTMTGAHLLFALGTTAYILAAVRWEESDLQAALGENYARYRETVPMLLPSTAAYEPSAPKYGISRIA
jgi:methanethiol S-methyltransferase